MRRCPLAIVAALCATLALWAFPASARSLRECNAAYAATRAAIRLSGQSKAAYIAACRAEAARAPDAPAAAAPQPADPMAPKPIMRP